MIAMVTAALDFQPDSIRGLLSLRSSESGTSWEGPPGFLPFDPMLDTQPSGLIGMVVFRL